MALTTSSISPTSSTRPSLAIIPQASQLLELPVDVLLEIFKNLSDQDIQSCRLLCKVSDTNILNAQPFWQSLFRRNCPGIDPQSITNGRDYLSHPLASNLPRGRYTSGFVGKRLLAGSPSLAILPGDFVVSGNVIDHKGKSYLKNYNDPWKITFCEQLQTEKLNTDSTLLMTNGTPRKKFIDASKGLLFEGSEIGDITIWDLKTGVDRTLPRPEGIEAETGQTTAIAFYKNYLITGHYSGMIQVWNLDSYEWVTIRTPAKSHKNLSYCIMLAA